MNTYSGVNTQSIRLQRPPRRPAGVRCVLHNADEADACYNKDEADVCCKEDGAAAACQMCVRSSAHVCRRLDDDAHDASAVVLTAARGEFAQQLRICLPTRNGAPAVAVRQRRHSRATNELPLHAAPPVIHFPRLVLAEERH